MTEPVLLGYTVSVAEMIFQDDHALDMLQQRILDQLWQNAEDSGFIVRERDAFFTTGKPMRAYDEDGTYIGTHILLGVEGRVYVP